MTTISVETIPSSGSSTMSGASKNNIQPKGRNQRMKWNRGNKSDHNHCYSAMTRIFGTVVVILIVMVLCLEQLRKDDLFSDLVSPAIILWAQPTVQVQMQVQVQAQAGVETRADDFLWNSNNNNNNNNNDADEFQVLVETDQDENDGGAVFRLKQDELAWHKVSMSFEKADAWAQHDWWNRYNLVHVVHVRVLQNQPRLVDYTVARLRQFQTFTLPSLQKQSNDEFLAILWTDTALLPETIQKLQQALVSNNNNNNSNNIVVIQFKQKRFDLQSPWFRETLDQSYILAGSYKLLMSYHKAAQTHAVLETFLDANDALSTNFIDTLQQEAGGTNGALTKHTDSFRIWCPSTILEWTQVSPPWYQDLAKLDWERFEKHHFVLQQQQQQQLLLATAQEPKSPEEKLADSLKEEIHNRTTADAALALATADADADVDAVAIGETFVDPGWFSVQHSVDKCGSSSAAGTTIGIAANYSSRTPRSSLLFLQKLRRESRTTWHQTVMPCESYGEANCLGFIPLLPRQKATTTTTTTTQSSSFGGQHAMLLRSRTITSAESRSIAPVFPNIPKLTLAAAADADDDNVAATYKDQQAVLWNKLDRQFGISPYSVRLFQSQFQANMDKILLDMLTICLPNNACKASNKKVLQDLLTTVGLGLKKPTDLASSLAAAAASSSSSPPRPPQQQQQQSTPLSPNISNSTIS